MSYEEYQEGRDYRRLDDPERCPFCERYCTERSPFFDRFLRYCRRCGPYLTIIPLRPQPRPEDEADRGGG